MQGEYAANQARTVELGQEAERRGRDSVGMILAGGLAGAMFMDSGSTQRREGEALERRNQRLREIAAQRGCAI
jgi:hypothetical protein